MAFYVILFFDFTELSVRRMPIFPLIPLNRSFDFTETPSPQRLHGEPSPSLRRRLAVAMASLRQLVEFKGAVQSIPTSGSENPRKTCIKSSKNLYGVKGKSTNFHKFSQIIIFGFRINLCYICENLLTDKENRHLDGKPLTLDL